jgi:hypothetical protein
MGDGKNGADSLAPPGRDPKGIGADTAQAVNRLEAAVLDVADHLESQKIPYMIFGGFANLHWGRPRLTEDIDIKVDVPEPAWSSFVDGLSRRFTLLVGDALAFVRDTLVVPVSTRTGVRVDLVMAALPYERAAIARAASVAVGERSVKISTAEDLILHKIISDRPRDRDDVEGVIVRQGPKLDRTYLDPKVQEMATGLGKPEIVEFYRSCLDRAG